MEIFYIYIYIYIYILFWVVATQIVKADTIIKTGHTEHLISVHFIVCKLYIHQNHNNTSLNTIEYSVLNPLIVYLYILICLNQYLNKFHTLPLTGMSLKSFFSSRKITKLIYRQCVFCTCISFTPFFQYFLKK